jgi:predicted thioesterase
MELKPGLEGCAETLVEAADTALEVGSGSLRVYATPCLAALMEGAACECLEGLLPEDQTSVGISLDLRHTAATPVGMAVSARAVLTAVEGKKLTFQITASDEAGEIGSATHQRVLVNTERFLQKTYEKL